MPNYAKKEDGTLHPTCYTPAEIDNSAIKYLSGIGEASYRPLMVTGSFEGASNWIDKFYAPILIDEDGSLVAIRPGTNGIKYDFYYDFYDLKEDGLVKDSLSTQMVYKPSFLGNGVNVRQFYHSNASEILLFGASNNKYYAVLTYGTLDQTAHKGLVIKKSDGSNLAGNCLLVKGTDKLYLCEINISYSTGVFWRIYTAPLSDFDVKSNGDEILFTVVEDWSSTSMDSVKTNGKNVTIANKLMSKTDPCTIYKAVGDEFDDELTGLSIGLSRGVCLYGVEKNNKLRLLSIFSVQWAMASKGMPYYGANMLLNISVTLDFSKKQAVLDNNPTPINTYFTEIITERFDPFDGLPEGSIGKNQNGYTIYYDIYCTCYISNDGKFYINGTPRAYEVNGTIAIDEIVNWNGDLFDSINGYYFNRKNKYAVRKLKTYGSEIGGSLGHWAVAPNNKLVVGETICYPINKPTAMADRLAYSYVDYQKYKNGKTDLGFEFNFHPPSSIRGFIDTTTVHKIFTTVSEITNLNSKDGNVVWRGGHLYKDKLSEYEVFDEFAVGSGFISITQVNWDKLVTTIENDVKKDSVTRAFDVDLYIPKDTQLPCFAVASIIDDVDGKGYVLLYTLDLNTRKGDVGTATQITRVYKRLAWSDNYSYLKQQPYYFRGNSQIVKLNDGNYFIHLVTTIWLSVIGDSTINQLCFVYETSNKKIHHDDLKYPTVTRRRAGQAIHVYLNYIALPYLGVGLMNIGYRESAGSLITFAPIGKTLVDLQTKEYSENHVILSQEVESGFTVYFPTKEEIIILGKKYELLPQNIDLRTIDPNPTNKTFYIYTKMREGKPYYHISKSPIPVTATTMYIGLLKTDNTKIVDINVSKKIRVGGYEISTVPRGHAIPVTEGLPSESNVPWLQYGEALKAGKKEENGYTYLPDGTILQWGVVKNLYVKTGGVNNSPATDVEIVFPIQFPKSIFAFTGTGQQRDNGVKNGNQIHDNPEGNEMLVTVNSKNNNKVNVRVYRTRGSNETEQERFEINWFAIGH